LTSESFNTVEIDRALERDAFVVVALFVTAEALCPFITVSVATFNMLAWLAFGV
jgi:hypothetical protein